MKRIFYAAALCLAVGIMVSCEDTPKNPGDFSKKCTLDVPGPVVSLKTGKTYNLTVAREADTVYKYRVIKLDTLKYEDGTPQLTPSGELQITNDTTYVYSKFTAKLIVMEPLLLPAEEDTFALDINSNARWIATPPVKEKATHTLWYFNHNSTNTGGGDSQLQFRTALNRTTTRVNTLTQTIITSDSTIMYRIPFMQYGRRDQPADY